MTTPAISKVLTQTARHVARKNKLLPTRMSVRSASVNRYDTAHDIALDRHTGDCSLPSYEQLSARILMNLNDSASAFDDHSDITCTTRPFYVLDGNGCRRASMYLVKDPLSDVAITSGEDVPKFPTNAQETPGTWLRQFSALIRHDSSVMLLQQ